MMARKLHSPLLLLPALLLLAALGCVMVIVLHLKASLDEESRERRRLWPRR